jgi:chemotaxis protein methyltransferase CheR
MAILTDGELHLLLTAIQQRTGIHTRPDQFESIGKTITRVMHEAGIDQTDEFLVALEEERSVFHRLVDAITVGETYFFREPKHFDFVRDQVIPESRDRFGDDHRFRAWSVACASGEEAYSLAILCQEIGQSAEILATDIAPEAITDARQARYRNWSFRGESFERVRPHLEPSDHGKEWTLNSEIRQRVRFRLLNLVSDDYPETKLGTRFLDLIYCRNVLIYFDRDTSERIVSQLAQCLSTGGWLVTASSDPPLAQIPGLAAVTNEFGTFYQRTIVDERKGISVRSTSDEAMPVKIESKPARSGDSVCQQGDRTYNAASGSSVQGETAAYRPDTSSNANSDSSGLCRRLRELDRNDLPTALAKIAELAQSHPLQISVHYHHGRLLFESVQVSGAAKAVQKALFLDQSAIMPHFLFGTIEIRRGQWESAERHFATARQLCKALPGDDLVPLSDGMKAAELLVVVDSQIAKLRNHSG